MKPITVWELYNMEKLDFSLNHISDGHEAGDVPQPKLDSDGKPFPSHKAWKGGKWFKHHAYLDNNKVVYED